MKYLRIATILLFQCILLSFNLYAQYDAGNIIYSQTSGTNLTAVLQNYIVEDFDGDFNTDIIMVKYNTANNANQLTWYKGDGNGSFTPQANLLNVENSHNENEIFYTDMNKDGINDIVFQNSNTGFTILVNDGFGNISSQINNEITYDNPIGVDLKELADIDGDGDMDGIFWYKVESPYSYCYSCPTQGHCLIGYNNGNGSLSNYVYLDNDEMEMFLLVETGDLDGDGDLDIICSGHKITLSFAGPDFYVNAFVRLYENISSNNFAKKEIKLPAVSEFGNLGENTFFSNIKLNDINSDGNDELLIEFATANVCGIHGEICDAINEFQVLDYNTQTEEFVILETYNSWLHSYTFGEELFEGHPYYGETPYGSPEIYYDAFHIQFGQQNTDNNLDILSINVAQGKLQWYLGDGNGNFNNTQLVHFDSQYSSIQPILRTIDIDNDTDLDIFVLLNDDTSSTLTVFKNLALSPSCTSILDLGNSSLTDGIYQAGTTLISAGEVVAGNNEVVLKAGDHIKLESGFKAPTNSTVKIRISACN